MKRTLSAGFILLALLYLWLGPVVVRVPLIDWTYRDGHATAGLTVWPLFVALDTGPLGLEVLPHEMCHWRHPFWREELCDGYIIPKN